MIHDATILVVEDDAVNRMHLRRGLEKRGYQVEVAASITEADHAVTVLKPDAVLLDLHLNQDNGLDWLKTLRQKHSATQLPVLIVTADEDEDVLVSAFAEGANDYVVKPVNMAVVVARLNTQLELQAYHRNEVAMRQWDNVRAMIVTYNHQINSPLTAALGYVDHMVRTGRADQIEALERSLMNVAKTIKKISELTSSELSTTDYVGEKKMITLQPD